MKIEEFKQKTAIVILAYADYESLELALASHAKFSMDAGVDIYILQNGRGTYDCERTYQVAKRYEYLFPATVRVVDDIESGMPFNSLKVLFNSKKFKKYDYIIKLDDDVMVLTSDWVDKLCDCYLFGKQQYGNRFAYATSLVNNNPYGFERIISYSKELADEYFSVVARDHFIGTGFEDSFGPKRILSKDRIYTGSNGTIWRYPYIARWLHEKTTMKPEQYVKLAAKLGREEVNNKERYSINCILFEKNLWTKELSRVEPKCPDDEHLLHAYCLKYNKKILADLSIPMVHLFFFSQRNECRDMMDDLRECYEKYLSLPFPIALCNNRMIEIENRLRFVEAKQGQNKRPRSMYGLVANGIQCMRENGIIYTIKYIPKRIIKGSKKK